MKGDVKGFGPKKTADIRRHVGRLDLRAEGALDAELLSLLYRAVFPPR